jgi:hypothetical protein
MRLLSLLCGLVLLAGCTASQVKWDKAAVQEVNKVAVVLYTVPISIEYYDNPQEKKKSALQALAQIATANNGEQAATVAQEAFIAQLNQENLRFKAISVAEMRNNAAFMSNASRHASAIAERKAKRQQAPAEDKGAAGKAMAMLGAFAKATGGNPSVEGIGPKGLPEFGLAPSWAKQPSALMGAEGEKEYIKAAIQALGVDAALVINDPGYSWGCEACVGGTGSGTTGSAFLATLVDRDGEVILEMRQWFAIGGASAAMAAYVINPLQHESLFKGHGEKMARVFATQYREEGGK